MGGYNFMATEHSRYGLSLYAEAVERMSGAVSVGMLECELCCGLFAMNSLNMADMVGLVMASAVRGEEAEHFREVL